MGMGAVGMTGATSDVQGGSGDLQPHPALTSNSIMYCSTHALKMRMHRHTHTHTHTTFIRHGC